MSSTVQIGYGNPVLDETMNRLRSEAKEFTDYCTQKGTSIAKIRANDLPILEKWAKPQQGPVVLSGITGLIIDADIQLTPREKSLRNQIERIEELLKTTGVMPTLLDECGQLKEQTTQSAQFLRTQREDAKLEIAPHEGWISWAWRTPSHQKLLNLQTETLTPKTTVEFS